MHSQECILVGMYYLECILKIENPNTGFKLGKDFHSELSLSLIL